ncbi:MAG: glycosyltransferase family 4 protein [Chloroflexi bacterium]|nr:glycosyltransferase family 4 protein [Chloroflexota bacterium]
MRILVLNHEYPPVGGGGGRVARDLNEGFSKHGHEVKIITPAFKGLPRSECYSHYEIIRVPSLRKYAYRATLKDMGAFIVSAYFKGSRLIRTWKPDIIQAHFAVPAGAAARMLSRRFHIPYFITAHLGDIPGGVPEKTGNWFHYFYPSTKKIWEEAEKVITVSHYTSHLAEMSYPGIHPQVIFNGVDTSVIKPQSFEIHNPPRIIFAGRFMEQKNPLMIIEVLNELKSLPWECVMMGDGPLKPLVEEKIHEYGIQNRFTLPGWISPEEVIKTYEQGDIFFMPSRSEGLPVAGVQAIAMGLAVVMADVGGCPDLVSQDENGFLIATEDKAGFIQALQKLLSNQDLLMKFKHQSREQSLKFDLASIIENYETVMEGIIKTYHPT